MLKTHETLPGDPVSSQAADARPTSHRQAVVDVFNSGLSWWNKVYGDNLPKGFFSYEMTRRKAMVIEAVTAYVAGRSQLKILECGCGPGGILRDLALEEHEVYGIDINSNFVAEMLEVCPRVKGTCCDLEEMPFSDGMFDVVICVGVMPYLRQDERAIAEMARVMKPGGLLVMSNPNYYMIDKFLDPYYYLAWPVRQAGRLVRKLTGAQSQATAVRPTVHIRRFRFEQLDPIFRRHALDKYQDRPVSYGPLRIWKKECLSLQRAIRMSERLVKLADRKPLRFLGRLANHRVTYLLKEPAAAAQ